jgi:uncharacterized protein YecE (DUF72 family)
MTVPNMYLGTSSWTAVDWETAYFPPHTKKAEFVPFYAREFNSVEVDSAFYWIPSAKTVGQWGIIHFVRRKS